MNSSFSIRNIGKIFERFMFLILCYIIFSTGTVLPIISEYQTDVSVKGLNYIHTVFYIIILAFIWNSGRLNGRDLNPIFLIGPLFIVYVFSAFSTIYPQYAIKKIEGAILATIVLTIISRYTVRNMGENDFIKGFIWISLLILAATILYRISSEFSGRDGRFLLNGPIVYGWITGFCSILALQMFFRSNQRVYALLALIFACAVVWTGSKGPAIALAASFFAVLLANLRQPLLVIAGISAVFIAYYFRDMIFSAELLSRFDTIGRVFFGVTTQDDAGSIDVRIIALSDSWAMFLDNTIFGVGFGNWDYFASEQILYPHNIFFETLSETGLIGIIVLSATILSMLRKTDYSLKVITMYFCICMSFSGDVSYLRLMFFLPLALKRMGSRQGN